MIIAGLQPETMYSITVAAYTMKGDGARSKPKQAVTKGAGKNIVWEMQTLSTPLVRMTAKLFRTSEKFSFGGLPRWSEATKQSLVAVGHL